MDILHRSLLHINELQLINVISPSNIVTCNDYLEMVCKKVNTLDVEITDNNYSNKLQTIEGIINDIKSVFKEYGSHTFEDFVNICLDNKYVVEDEHVEIDIINVLNKLFVPISYKSILWANLPNNIIDDISLPLMQDFNITKQGKSFQCFPILTEETFKESCSTIKVVIHKHMQKETLIIKGNVHNIPLECFNDNKYIKTKLNALRQLKYINGITADIIERFINSLTIKDVLIHSSDALTTILNNYIHEITILKTKSLENIVNNFIIVPMSTKRSMLIQLLLFNEEHDFKYISYLLYDMLAKDTDVNSVIQHKIYNSLTTHYKKYFKDAMSSTLQYTEELCNVSNKIPLEQRICLLKVSDVVKEKAMVKLKEIKSKSDDTGSKARHFLEGLLQIPFGDYKTEEIMYIIPSTIILYNKIIAFLPDDIKGNYTKVSSYIEIKQQIEGFTKTVADLEEYYYIELKNKLCNCKKNNLIKHINLINVFLKNTDIVSCHKKITYSNKTIKYIKDEIIGCLDKIRLDAPLWEQFMEFIQYESYINYKSIIDNIDKIKMNTVEIKDYMTYINNTLDDSVYGHGNVKTQIKRIIGQWITGDNSGYCFGFEGPPGVGKTSLAKNGISKCMRDKDGNFRPFSFIAVGGSSNGSTLEGHNYTYVGSTWGKIVDILMDSKCMNPIIFIDELDKISNTENGKELIGILTHLIDSSQNDKFQDKYFNGVDIDISKALFIFSYNDASKIDKILLDRIHRVKFERLTILDKIEISSKHLLKDISKKLGLNNHVYIDDETIRFIINSYTNESGVRKLKEILFDILSQINLELLDDTSSISLSLPIIINRESIEQKYLFGRLKMKPHLIHLKPEVGLINGLWANSLGMGGILSIESSFIYSPKFMELKLTGMQGDVMKESMNVAKTVAWNLLTPVQRNKIMSSLEESKHQGIHIHCPDGATNKDGPSAGTAITMIIYSLLTNKKINNKLAITGEINIQGKVTAIGGLDLKIIGGIEAGVTVFIYPEENQEDFEKFVIKYENNKELLEGITFHKVKTVKDVLNIVFVK